MPIKKTHANATNNELLYSTNEGFVITTMSSVSQRNKRKQEKKTLFKLYFVSSCGDFPCLYDEFATHQHKFVKNRRNHRFQQFFLQIGEHEQDVNLMFTSGALLT